MSQKNIEVYLAEQELEYQKKSEKIEKRKNRFKKKFFIFGIIFAVLLIGTFAMDLISKDSIYKELKDVQISDVEAINKIANSKEAVAYPDLFDKFEAGYLGNKSMNSLNYGLVAENKYGFTYVNENGAIVFNKDNTETIIANEAISQINIAANYIIFRGTDKKLYTCKHDGTEKNAIVNDKVGTVVLAGDNIYYVNYTKSNVNLEDFIEDLEKNNSTKIAKICQDLISNKMFIMWVYSLGYSKQVASWMNVYEKAVW